jgi:hypothetical protein
MQTEFAGLALTIIVSSVGATAWISKQLAELRVDLNHAFRRLEALEADRHEPKPARKRTRK